MVVNVKSSAEYVLELSGLARDNAHRAGAKAANEAELLKAGFLVPSGFVLTTDAFERFLAANHLSPDSLPETVASAPMPSEIVDALHAGVASLGNGPLAVRSSAVAEDLPEASFAGQYETILNVQGAEALEAAVRRCWESFFNPRVASYREAHGPPTSGMAVLVQRLVQAEVAGVTFTANPITGDRDEVVINVVRGMGDRLVSGDASPDQWIVRGQDARCLRAPEGAINADQAKAIAAMAQRVEAHFGEPQDIEWALAAGQLYALQARPITTLPDEAPEMIPVVVDPPPGFWQREASHVPLPHSPMNRSFFQDTRNAAIKHMLGEFGVLVESGQLRNIGGWEYLRMVPLGGKDRPALPKPMMWLLARVVPMMRARIRQAAEAVHSDKAGRFVRRWHDEWRPEIAARIGELRDVDLGQLSDAALGEHLGDVILFLNGNTDIHIVLHGALCFVLYDLVSTCKALLGWDDQKAYTLVNGTSHKSTEPTRHLHTLAQMVRERPAVHALLEQVDGRIPQQLVDADPAFAKAFARYMHEYGCRALRYEVADPTLAETPSLVLALIRDQIARDYDPGEHDALLEQKRAAAIAEARSALSGRPEELERFERVLACAQRAYPVREDNEFYTVSAPIALLRYALLELGRRLTYRSVIEQRDDVFFLEVEEALSTLFGGGDHRALVRRRKAERAWVIAHPGAPSFGRDPGPPPSFDFLPREARFAMEALLWYMEQAISPEQSQRSQAPGAVLEGIAASPGQYTGPVRVIMNEGEFHKLQPGDVLVCPVTSPVWSVLFPSVGALVTDTGGILSHPAIIAREYRVPAVVALGNATSILRDGQTVTVDGAAGTVKAIS